MDDSRYELTGFDSPPPSRSRTESRDEGRVQSRDEGRVQSRGKEHDSERVKEAVFEDAKRTGEIKDRPRDPSPIDPDPSHSNDHTDTTVIPNQTMKSYARRHNASVTDIKVAQTSHTWTVRNFSHCYQTYIENHMYMRKDGSSSAESSPRRPPTADTIDVDDRDYIKEDRIVWSVKIYPSGSFGQNRDFTFFCISRESNFGSRKSAPYKCWMSLMTGHGEKIKLHSHPNPSNSDFVWYLKREELMDRLKLEGEDMIVLTVDVEAAVDVITTHQRRSRK